MSQVYFISDLHLGHRNILKFSGGLRQGTTVEEHDEWVLDQINSVVRPRDTLIILGDLAFTEEGILKSRFINCHRHLIMGNHDKFPLSKYQEARFHILPGIVSYKRMWLSHCPIHEAELRGKVNIHGHVHMNTIPDERYLNVCVEALNGIPISLEEIRSRTTRYPGGDYIGGLRPETPT